LSIDSRTEGLKAALKFLGLRARFANEIRRHLETKGYDEDSIQYVLGFLIERRLVNDEATTKAVIERSSGKRAVGLRQLRAELERLGAPENVIAQHLAGIDVNEAERALDALKAKYKAGAERAKAGRFLYSRGFAEEVIESALDSFCGT
jgi:regulatory protein